MKYYGEAHPPGLESPQGGAATPTGGDLPALSEDDDDVAEATWAVEQLELFGDAGELSESQREAVLRLEEASVYLWILRNGTWLGKW